MLPLQTLTTIDQYVDYYYDQLKQELASHNLQISKVGFVGFFLHILGFTQSDIQQYYGSLFNESFLVTSIEDHNLYMHGQVFQYPREMAKSSKAVGTMSIDINSLPFEVDLSILRLTIADLQIQVNDIIFTLNSTYTIRDNSCIIEHASGEVDHIPFTPSHNYVNIVDLDQHVIEDIYFRIPNYSEGSFFQKIIEPENTGFISSVEVFVQDEQSEEYIQYNVLFTKFFSTSLDNAVFIKYLPNNQISLEFGSGTYGKYIPNSQIRISIKLTKGLDGNISNNTGIIPTEGTIQVYENESNQFTINASDILSFNIDYSEGGTNPLSGEELRLDIIKWAQTRNNLISKTDFYNILSYIPDMLVLFRKTSLSINDFYLFLVFKDQYQYPIKSKTVSLSHNDFNLSNKNILYKPKFTIDTIDYISPFIYIFDNFIRKYDANIYVEKYISTFYNIEAFDTSISVLPLSLNIEYSSTSYYSRFTIYSYSDINDYVIYIEVPQYSIVECMNVFDANTHEFILYNDIDGLIDKEIDVVFKVYKDGDLKFIYSKDKILLMYNISDLLSLKIFETPQNDPLLNIDMNQINSISDWGQYDVSGPWSLIAMNHWIINIPVMLSSEYEDNIDFYDEKFLATLGRFSIDSNQMISDSIQIRFINTYDIKADILKYISKQQYNFDVLLPLKIKVTILGYKSISTRDGLNTTSLISDLELQLASLLYEKYTGMVISFYHTQIEDVIHGYDWVKYCKVEVFDSADYQIPEGNIEILDQVESSSNLSKFSSMSFCPIYLYWDLNNIDISITFE